MAQIENLSSCLTLRTSAFENARIYLLDLTTFPISASLSYLRKPSFTCLLFLSGLRVTLRCKSDDRFDSIDV